MYCDCGAETDNPNLECGDCLNSQIIKSYRAFVKSNTSPYADIYTAAAGVSGEGGELLGEFRKAEERNISVDWNKADNEAGDVVFYLQEYCNFRNIEITDLMELNRDKLEKRYPEGFDFTGGKRE